LNTYTIYDNLDDGFTVVYQYYNFSSQKFIKKKIVCKSKSFMLEFTKKLILDGYKFVGKI
jgi:hypothetical protein